MRRGGALAWVTLAAVCGSAGCNQSGAPNPTDGGAPGRVDCLGIRNCVKDRCTIAASSEACVQDCMVLGSPEAQSRYRVLTTCLVNACCTNQKGCGGGNPTCSAAGTPACETCTCKAQCDPADSPCRDLARVCYGIVPDCSGCT